MSDRTCPFLQRALHKTCLDKKCSTVTEFDIFFLNDFHRRLKLETNLKSFASLHIHFVNCKFRRVGGAILLASNRADLKYLPSICFKILPITKNRSSMREWENSSLWVIMIRFTVDTCRLNITSLYSFPRVTDGGSGFLAPPPQKKNRKRKKRT